MADKMGRMAKFPSLEACGVHVSLHMHVNEPHAYRCAQSWRTEWIDNVALVLQQPSPLVILW